MNASLPGPDRVSLAIEGDSHAFEAVIAGSVPTVLGWCKRLAGPRLDPEDLTHDIMLIVVDRLPRLRNPHAYPAWLFQITRKTLANRRRRVWLTTFLEREPADRRDNPEELHARRERIERIQSLLDQLPDKQRQVVVLHDLEGRSDTETAELLGVAKGTVKSRLRTARLKIRDLALDAGLWPELQLAGGGA